jgi:hypothetical protein
VTAALASLSSAIIKLFAMNEASQTPLAFATWFTVLAGSAIPVAMVFLKYVQLVISCYERCPSDAGFSDCLDRINLRMLFSSEEIGDT